MEKARYTLTEYGFFTAENAVHIIGCAVAITLLRYALNFVIFKVWHSKFACLYEQQTNISSIKNNDNYFKFSAIAHNAGGW